MKRPPEVEFLSVYYNIFFCEKVSLCAVLILEITILFLLGTIVHKTNSSPCFENVTFIYITAYVYIYIHK